MKTAGTSVPHPYQQVLHTAILRCDCTPPLITSNREKRWGSGQGGSATEALQVSRGTGHPRMVCLTAVECSHCSRHRCAICRGGQGDVDGV
jgi:hypothetical protein